MRKHLLLIFIGVLSSTTANALSELQTIVTYSCSPNKCDLKCWGVGGNLEFQYAELTVLQFKDHPRRLWLTSNNEWYVLADDYTCKFSGKPTFKFQVVPLNPPQPQCTCIGNQCTPPGCRR